MKLHAVLISALALWVASAAAEVLFVPDKTGNMILRVGSSGAMSAYQTENLNAPVAAAMDADRTLYVANAGDGSVMKLPYGGAAEMLVSGLSGLAGIGLGPDGSVYVSVTGAKQILKVTGVNATTPYAAVAAGTSPSSLVFGKDGVLYVADPDASKIFAVSVAGEVTEYSSAVVQPKAVALDAAGNVVAADAGESGRIVQFSGSGQATTVVSNLGDVQGLASDRAGNLYVSVGSAGVVKKVLPSKAVEDFAAGLGAPAQIVAVQPQARVLGYKGETVAAANGADFSVNGAKFSAFGPPATVESGYTVFRATLLSGTAGVSAANANALWLSNPDGSLRVIARQGSPAPGTTNAAFATFSEPVVSNAGGVAFRAALRGGDATAGRTIGIWSDAASGDLALVARLGDQPAGVDDTPVKYTAFTQLTLPESGGPIFIATIAGAKVTSANNQGVWIRDWFGTRLLVRKGDMVPVGMTQKKLISFKLFQAAPFLLGQTRSFNADGSLAFLGTFDDGSQAECRVVNGVVTAAVYKGESAADPSGAAYASFGLPALGGAGAIGGANMIAYRGVLRVGVGQVAAANSVGIWTAAEWSPEQLVARAGFPAPGTRLPGATADALFLGFSDPAVNAFGEAAFRATLKTGDGVTAANGFGIWSTFGGSVGLIVRGRDVAPGVPAGAAFTAFPEFALADDRLVFTGTITGAGITGANNMGVWVAEATGGKDLLLRKGDKVTVNGTPRTVSAITLFQAPPFVTGQGRNVAADGSVAALVKFTDGSTAIVRVGVI